MERDTPVTDPEPAVVRTLRYDTDTPAAEPAARETSAPDGGTAGLSQLDHLQKIGIAVAGLLTVAEQLWLAVQQDWQLIGTTLLMALLVGTGYAAFFRNVHSRDKRKRVARWVAIATLICIPLASISSVFAYSYLPRLEESGNTIAVSRFDGPHLPHPFEACRPSAMLVHAIADVADRYGHVAVFEVPYSVAPEGRWASFWAQGHGLLDAADVIVYGDYDLVRSSDRLTEADEMTLNTRVDAVPKVPIADKAPPLYSWTFPRRTVKIAQLCAGGTTLSQMSDFVGDARRLTLAVAASDLFAGQDYEGAKRAAGEAKDGLRAGACDRANDGSACHGVLEFYLANVDLRFGNFAAALTEYQYAADHLASVAPLISLGELSMRLGRQTDGFAYLDRAVQSNPTSVAALATRASYERDYLRPQAAMIDLDRALRLPATHPYDLSALSRALYQRGGKGDAFCGIAMLARLISRPDFDRRTMLDTFARYGIWLTTAKRGDGAVKVLQAALAIDPYNVEANYRLGTKFDQDGRTAQATAFFLRAVLAPSFTDEDFLHRGDAATELRRRATTAAERDAERDAAIAAYGSALQLNANAVYARLNRGRLEDELREFGAADTDLRVAAQLHPADAYVLSTYAAFLRRRGRLAEAQRYAARTRTVELLRIPADDARQWSSETCSYAGMDSP